MQKKHLLISTFLTILIAQRTNAQVWQPSEWPVLKHYDSAHLLKIALPLGGIGTGTVSLGGRGELRDWQIMNVPAIGYGTVPKSYSNDAPFFSIYYKQADKASVTKGLMGPIDFSEYLDEEGDPVFHHGIPRFAKASFDAAYPFGQVNLSDPNSPIKVKIMGFNPLIPTDENNSGIPIAVLTYQVTNHSNKTIEVSVCGTMRNFIGQDDSKVKFDWKNSIVPLGINHNHNKFKEENGLNGIFMYSDSVDKNDPAFGTIALTTNSKSGVTHRISSVANSWSNGNLNFWDDFSEDGELTEKSKEADNDPMASLAVKRKIEAGKTESFTFFITWNFPNRKAWSPTVVGNYYSTLYKDAWDVAAKTVPQLPELEKRTLTFTNAFLQSSYPTVVKEAALFNVSNLRSQTVFRIKSGEMMGWEGIFDRIGSCKGSCTHVWNYEQATPFLFGNLSKTMRDVEFKYATDANGMMSYRASLPLDKASSYKVAAADGQMGTIMKFYRDWQLSGDNQYLKDNWNRVKLVMSYAWQPKGWDGNQDGIMEGNQHNTMDVSYFGPNPQMGLWYLGALKAGAKMASYMNDKEFESKCLSLYANGTKYMDDSLFNGEYYEQHITDPKTFEYIDMSDKNTSIPPFQLGKGCLVDQLVGQYMASICGLGYLVKAKNINTTLKSIMKYNYFSDLGNHYNNMRSFVMGDEAGLVMASWPKGRLKVPFPYFNEAMTGFEYTAAIGMMYEGMDKDGLKCIKSIRDRFDGQKRNPFDEPECGHHYARAMASWASILAISNFHYSAVDQTISFTNKPGQYFWSTGYSFGTAKITKDSKGQNLELKVIEGNLSLNSVSLDNLKTIVLPSKTDIKGGETKSFHFNQ